jgi:branched-chain amino acid transport system ATP-binding protein
VILVEGRIAHVGKASELADDPMVGELYLGARKGAHGASA